MLENSCTASLNCLEQSESCYCNPFLTALCLSLVILDISSATQAYCDGKKGSQLPCVQFYCARDTKEFLSLIEEAVLIFQNERSCRYFVLKMSSRL